MDADTYRHVLAELGRLELSTDSADGDEFTEPEFKLRQDLVGNKVVWVGSFAEDLWYFLININPVLGMCYSHPLHPISRCNRFTIYALSFFWIVIVTMAVSQGKSCLQCGVCLDCHFLGCTETNSTCISVWEREWMHIQQRPQLGVEIRTEEFRRFMGNFCCSIQVSGALGIMQTYGDFWGGVLYSFLANTILSLGCFQLMLCGCAQSRSRRQRKLCEHLGQLLFALISFIVIGTVLRNWWGYHWGQVRVEFALKTFISVKLVSWTGATILQVLMFTLLHWLQRPKRKGSLSKCLDAPQGADGSDPRCTLARILNPRHHVLAVEYLEVSSRLRRERSGEGLPDRCSGDVTSCGAVSTSP